MERKRKKILLTTAISNLGSSPLNTACDFYLLTLRIIRVYMQVGLLCCMPAESLSCIVNSESAVRNTSLWVDFDMP